jgi:hypothetical protein
MGDLHRLGFLKNYKFPFFIFKDNRNMVKKIKLDSMVYEHILQTDEYYLIYKHYLPRHRPMDLFKHSPDVEEFFNSNKKAINELNKLHLDPLITEKENFEWFVYDDESLNFLMDMEKVNFKVHDTIKFNDSSVLFEDRYRAVMLSSKQCKRFYISITFDMVTKKLEAGLGSTANELLKKVNQHLDKIKPELCFIPRMKILKVRSLK